MAANTQYILCELTRHLLHADNLASDSPFIQLATQLTSKNAKIRGQFTQLTDLNIARNTAFSHLTHFEGMQGPGHSQQSIMFTQQLRQCDEQVRQYDKEREQLNQHYQQLQTQLIQGLEGLILHISSGPKGMEKSQYVANELQRHKQEQQKLINEITRHSHNRLQLHAQLERLGMQIYNSIPAEERVIRTAPQMR